MEERRSYYAIIPANVRYDKRLPAGAKLLYGEITALCNEKGFCWASNAYFSELYSASKSTISRWVSALNEFGYISVDIVHKDGTKEIEQRTIRISDYPIRKNAQGYTQKCVEGIRKNAQENNTMLNNTLNKIYNQVVTFLNEKTGKSYSDKSAQTRKLIDARIKDGFAAEDFEKVISNMASHWLGDEKMEQYLRPQTLFGTKFESYLNTKPKKGGAKFTEREYTQDDLESKIDDPLKAMEKFL